ncbi:hypothetical protein VSDG_02847 [Cytospora chrysosperma]|uniref:Uncharacterized protein n=1 Tax=Cytospora chrysosperma TaxID=252740 RepID=A0A423WCH9_CYTCH|nr:hypothetical protein VSDG_02847 [Valsa sordida]
MPGPDTITALRGFKVRISTLDAFLFANGNEHGTGFHPSSKALQQTIFRHYSAESYVHVYAQGRITPECPPEQVPRGFEELRQEVLAYSKDREGDLQDGLIGLFIVFTQERACPNPPELQERYQSHRNEVHGTDEPLNGLPEDV